MDEYISRPEHEEFVRRIEDEEKRQNKRLEVLEENVRQIAALTVSVEKMAVSMEAMTKELGVQGKRIEKMEAEPGKNWSTLKMGVIGAIAAAVGGGLFAAIINFL